MEEPEKRQLPNDLPILKRWEQDEAEWDRAFERAAKEREARNEPPNGMTEEEIAEWRRQRGLPPEVTPRGTP